MTWRMVIVNQHSKLSYQNNALVYKSKDEIEKIHLSEIHTIMIETTDVLITSALVAKLIEYKIKLIFCDEKRLPTAELVAYYGSHDTSKRVEKQIHWDVNCQKIIWTEIIHQKIKNQALHLLSKGKVKEAEMLQNYLVNLLLYDESNREGHAAKVYFNALFGKDFARELENDVNASLDYGYTLLLSIFSREIVNNGCLTQLGLKHSNYFNQFNLSSDLMEPFRPLVDKIVADNKGVEFVKMKRKLLNLFSDTYLFEGKDMYLTNIVEIYVKKVLQALNQGDIKIPEFIFTWGK